MEGVSVYSQYIMINQSRQGNLEEFFHFEEQLKKPSSKSDFSKCLNVYANLIAAVAENYEAPRFDACVIDGPAFVQMNPPLQSKIYGEYVGEVHEKISGIFKTHVQQIDVVFDVYHRKSRKQQARKS